MRLNPKWALVWPLLASVLVLANTEDQIDDQKWIKINRDFPNTISNVGQTDIERFFYKRGRMTYKYFLSDAIRKVLDSDTIRKASVSFQVSFVFVKL